MGFKPKLPADSKREGKPVEGSRKRPRTDQDVALATWAENSFRVLKSQEWQLVMLPFSMLLLSYLSLNAPSPLTPATRTHTPAMPVKIGYEPSLSHSSKADVSRPIFRCAHCGATRNLTTPSGHTKDCELSRALDSYPGQARNTSVGIVPLIMPDQGAQQQHFQVSTTTARALTENFSVFRLHVGMSAFIFC
jgi:hypothetical protein